MIIYSYGLRVLLLVLIHNPDNRVYQMGHDYGCSCVDICEVIATVYICHFFQGNGDKLLRPLTCISLSMQLV